MKKLLFILGVGLLSVSAYANTPTYKTIATEAETLKLCADFVEAINKDLPDPKKALDIVRIYSPLPKAEIDTLQYQATNSFQILAERYGSHMGTVHIDTDKYAKDHFIRHEFLLKRSNFPLSASCTFYKPKDAWILHSFFWNDNPTLLED